MFINDEKYKYYSEIIDKLSVTLIENKNTSCYLSQYNGFLSYIFCTQKKKHEIKICLLYKYKENLPILFLTLSFVDKYLETMVIFVVYIKKFYIKCKKLVLNL